MSNVFFLKLTTETNSGLSNQLLTLVSGILFCIRTKREVLVVDKFLTEINTNNFCSISQVFNLFAINNYLHRYKLKIIDGFNINSTAFSPISWNVIVLAEKFNNEKLLAFIDEIYRNIYFNKYLINYAEKFIDEKINKPNEDNIENTIQKINVIHLRTEDDAIEFWSKQNNISNDDFKKHLFTKYIELIKTNIQKTDTTIILTANLDNEIVNFLRENDYNIKFVDKKFKSNQNGRELNAIIDLIISKCCNNVFIGCDGSTYTRLLLRYMIDTDGNKIVKKITFDINNILN
jgi:hypothetical protein